MPNLGNVFDPLPEDEGERSRSRRAARRTAGPARPRGHARLQPLVRDRRADRPAGADPDRAGAEDRPVSPRAASSSVGALVLSLALVGVYLAAGGASYTPEQSPATPANRGPGRKPAAASKGWPRNSRSRRSTAPPASSASAASARPRARHQGGPRTLHQALPHRRREARQGDPRRPGAGGRRRRRTRRN